MRDYRRTMLLILLGLASAPAWSAGKQCSLDARDMFTFAWVPKTAADPTVGSIRITDRTGQTVQVLDNQTYYYGGDEAAADSLDTRDFNNDGCGDLVFASDVAAIGNTSNTAFLYEPDRGRFVLHELLSGIGGLDVDPSDKHCVSGFWKGGAMDVGTQKYCWSQGRLVLKEEFSVSPLINPEGEVACYVHTTTTYAGGKKKTRTKCTAKF